MNLKYSGSEKGLKLTPIGIDHYADLLKSTALSLSSDDKPDPDKMIFPISDRRSIFDDPPKAHVSIDQVALSALRTKKLYLALMVKEPSSRSCRIILNENLTDELAQATISLSCDDFADLAFGSSVFIDILIYEKTRIQGPLIQGFKRFSLSFSAVAGLWSIESVEPHFFVSRGGGLNTMFLTEMDFDGEDDLKTKPAIDVVTVYINNTCVREFERLTNKLDASGDVIRRFFVHGIILKIAQQLLASCIDFPREADDGSVASKLLEILQINSEADYLFLRDNAQRDPEKLSLRIQHRLELAGAVTKFTGGRQ
jgi:hypothetical protein